MKNLIKTILKPSSKIMSLPNINSFLETESLYGEQVSIGVTEGEWAKCKTVLDNYEGWIKISDTYTVTEPTHRVIKPRSFIYLNNDVKSDVFHYLPMGSKLKINRSTQKWSEVLVYIKNHTVKGYVPTNHLVPIKNIVNDWVSIAESLLGTPYRWGGRDTIGIDCSALIQLSLETINVNFPRNTKMQEKYTEGLEMNYKHLNRGVLVFWEGHVGVMVNKDEVLHSNGFFMGTIVENLKQAEKRIKINYGSIKKVINKFQIL